MFGRKPKNNGLRTSSILVLVNFLFLFLSPPILVLAFSMFVSFTYFGVELGKYLLDHPRIANSLSQKIHDISYGLHHLF